MSNEYLRVREEVWDPALNEWRAAEVNTVTLNRSRRISNVTAVQRLGSYRVGPGSFLELTLFEASADRTFQLELRDNRGTVGLTIVKNGGPYPPNPYSPARDSILRGNFQGTFSVFVADAAAGGTYCLTFEGRVRSFNGPGTENLRVK